MATNALRSLWAEPRPTNAPERRPRDWALVAVLICWSLVEVVLRQDLAPRPLLLLAVLAVLGPCCGKAGAFGDAFRLMEFHEHRSIVYLDNLRIGGLILEDPRLQEPRRPEAHRPHHRLALAPR